MSVLSSTRALAATTLHVGAALLAGTAKGIDALAGLVQPSTTRVQEEARAVAEEAAARRAAAERVAARRDVEERVTPSQEPRTRPYIVASAPGMARASASHVEELARRPAAEVIARVPDLSTEDLRLLAEFEQGHRKRKTVLAAIEDTAGDFTG